jgi:hypothetical protein
MVTEKAPYKKAPTPKGFIKKSNKIWYQRKNFPLFLTDQPESGMVW